VLDLGAGGQEACCCRLRQVYAVAVAKPSLAARQGQERLKEALLLPPGLQYLPAGGAPLTNSRASVAQRHLQQCPVQGERGAQLVRGASHEVPLCLEGRLKASQQLVESVREFPELIIRPGEGKALVQAGGGDPARSRGDGAQRAQHPSGH
jgi:hypothetical protein